MNPKFEQHVNEIERLHEALMAMPPVTRDNLDACDYPGVYLFTENGIHLYVGRTKRPLKTRLMEHTRPSVKDAPFAFRLAREATGKMEVTYEAGNGRRELLHDEQFLTALKQQKLRIEEMGIRYVQVADPTTQALLEIYTSTVLGTPHNEFTTS
jgi:hypothetical protein